MADGSIPRPLSSLAGSTSKPLPPTTPNSILGTLVIIVLKARNLPNKARIGKQAPFISLQLGITKKKTVAIERGGQNPEWDAEFRFPIPADPADLVAPEGLKINKNGGVGLAVDGGKAVVTPAPARKIMRMACWADDPRDPKLIGEIMIELDEILTKGASDKWWTLEKKGRYAGEIYLEMTFYSNAPPPPKVAKPLRLTSGTYGGPGAQYIAAKDSQNNDDNDDDDDDPEYDSSGDGDTPTTQLSAASNSNFGFDYPDADMGPLARSVSALSFQSNVPIPAQPPPRQDSYGNHHSHSSSSSVQGNFQPQPPQSQVGDFEQLAQAHYASQQYATFSSHNQVPPPQQAPPRTSLYDQPMQSPGSYGAPPGHQHPQHSYTWPPQAPSGYQEYYSSNPPYPLPPPPPPSIPNSSSFHSFAPPQQQQQQYPGLPSNFAPPPQQQFYQPPPQPPALPSPSSGSPHPLPSPSSQTPQPGQYPQHYHPQPEYQPQPQYSRAPLPLPPSLPSQQQQYPQASYNNRNNGYAPAPFAFPPPPPPPPELQRSASVASYSSNAVIPQQQSYQQHQSFLPQPPPPFPPPVPGKQGTMGKYNPYLIQEQRWE